MSSKQWLEYKFTMSSNEVRPLKTAVLVSLAMGRAVEAGFKPEEVLIQKNIFLDQYDVVVRCA
jgi:hypothetical protein